MNVRKDARVVYYPANEVAGMPAHVRLHWFDGEGRKHHHLLDLSPEEVARVAAMPDLFAPDRPPLEVETCFGCRDFCDVRELEGHVCPRCRERGEPE